VRFSTLGDSKSGLYRAFKLEEITGEWWNKIKSIKQLNKLDPKIRVVVPNEQSEALVILEKEVNSSVVISSYLSIGSPNFEWLAAFMASQKDLDEATNFGFSFVHNELKQLTGAD